RRGFDRRPAFRGAPLLRMDREIMDRRLLLEAGIQAYQIRVEETQHLGEQRKVRLDGASPWRDIDACAVIPGTEQKVARILLLREMARDRAIHVACAVEPARHREDRNVAPDAMRDRIRADRGRAEEGIVRQPFLAKAELRHEIGLPEIAEMLTNGI